MDDVKAIEKANRHILRVEGNVSGSVQAVYGSKNTNTQVTGATPLYAVMRNAHAYYGRFFTTWENENQAESASSATPSSRIYSRRPTLWARRSRSTASTIRWSVCCP